MAEFAAQKLKRAVLSYLAERPSQFDDLSAAGGWSARFGVAGAESILAQVIWQAVVDEHLRLHEDSRTIVPTLDSLVKSGKRVPRVPPREIRERAPAGINAGADLTPDGEAWLQRQVESERTKEVEQRDREPDERERLIEDVVRLIRAEAERDGLTGLGTRAAFDRELRRAVEGASEQSPLTVAFIDIDYFKKVNDTHGHPQGDRVLAGVAGYIGAQLKNLGTAYRYGGEEITVLLPGHDRPRASRLLEQVRSGVACLMFFADSESLKVTVSIGHATVALAKESLGLLERANRAVYAAKQAGRNCVRSEVDE